MDPDDWVVQSITIEYYNEGGPQRCLFRAQGSPLIKFLGDRNAPVASYTLVLTNYPNLC